MAEVITEYISSAKDDIKYNNRWWFEKKGDIHKHLFRTVSVIETRQFYRTQENIKHARLYSDLEVLGLYAGLYSPQVRDSMMPNRLSLNVIKSCIDTATAKIAKERPRPLFLTEGGNWGLRRKAESLTKFMDGQFDAMGHYETKADVFRDEGIFGTGFTKFYIDARKNEICSERALTEEILVDDAEAIYGKPRTLYQKRLVDKRVLVDQFKEHEDAIMHGGHDIRSGHHSEALRDLVKVVEAWRLPSGPDSNDGMHAICIDSCDLLIEKWDFDWFPFTRETWTRPLVGFYGIGIARELTGIQIEINKILRSIQQSMHLFSVPRIAVENGSEVNMHALNNQIAAIIKFTQTPPQFLVPPAMSADVYQHLWNLVQKAYEITGISQLSAQSLKPAGLNYGVAMREYKDVESERFQIVGQRRENGFLNDAKIVLEFAKILSKEKGDFKVKISDQGSSKTIRFSEVDLKADKYLMRAFPTSLLPTQPAAKMQTIIDYAQAGFFDKETAQDLLDFPDIKAATSQMIAPRRLVFKTLDAMVDSGVYESPEPVQNLQLAQQVSQLYYMSMKNDGMPEDKLELVRRYIQDCQTMIQMAQQSAMQEQMAAMQAQQAQAMPAQATQAPTNELLPQQA